MSDPKTILSLLGDVPKGATGPRFVPCSRCSALAAEYERHDRSWRPPPAAMHLRDGRWYILANCEACNWIEYQAAWNRRFDAIGSVSEPGLSTREVDRRAILIDRLNREKRKYIEARRVREQIDKTSVNGAPLSPSATVGCAVTEEAPTFSDWLTSKGITTEDFARRKREQIEALQTLEESKRVRVGDP